MTTKEEFDKSIELLVWDVMIGTVDKSKDQLVDRLDLLCKDQASKTCEEISRLLKEYRPEGPKQL